jgi:hypothetical protein
VRDEGLRVEIAGAAGQPVADRRSRGLSRSVSATARCQGWPAETKPGQYIG